MWLIYGHLTLVDGEVSEATFFSSYLASTVESFLKLPLIDILFFWNV
jgi:hypothetical protein